MSNIHDISTYLRYLGSAQGEEKKRLAEEERQIAAHKLHEAQTTPGTPEYEQYRGGSVEQVSPLFDVATTFVGGGIPKLAQKAMGMAYQPGKITTNFPQNLEGFYSGGVGAQLGASAIGAGKAVGNVLRQYITPQASANFNVAGLSHATQKIVANGLQKMDELSNLSKRQKLTPEEAAEYTNTGKEVYGQLGYHYLIGKQGGAKIPILEQWKDANYHTIGKFTRDEFLATKKHATKIGAELSKKSMDEAYDLISETWRSSIKKSPLGEKTIMAVKKSRGPRFAGVHDNDALTSSKGKLIKDVLTANGKDFDSVDDLAKAFDGYGLKIKKISDDGIWVTFSPERASGFVEGGTNALVKIQPNRKINLFTTDEHDMAGLVPLGYDRMVTVLPAWGVDFFKATRGAKTAKGIRTPSEDVKRAKKNLKEYKENKRTHKKGASTKTTLPVFTKDQRAAAQAVADFAAPVNYSRFAARRAVPLGLGYGLLGNNETSTR
jgi:hypothetical protein